jgi:hypothetical protein
MYEVTVFIYDYVTDKTFKKSRALMFQPIPGMVYREDHTTQGGENHIWLADMVAIVADFEDCAGVTSQGYVVVLSIMQSESLCAHQFAAWLANTGWVETDPPKGMNLGEVHHEDEDDGPDEPE